MKKVLPIVIVVLLILGIGGFGVTRMLQRYKPSEEMMDYTSAMNLSDDEYTITLNHELLEEERALSIDGKIYLSMDLVTTTLNTRFCWDNNEKLFLFTTPTQLIKISPNEETYTVETWDDEEQDSEGYEIVKSRDGQYYVASDYVLAHTQMEFNAYTEPNRVVIATQWKEQSVAKMDEGAAIRYRGGIKSEVLRLATADEQAVVIEKYEDWTNVATEDGYIGWVQNRYISDAETETPQAPAFEQPEYTSIHKNYKINMGWHQVMSSSANDNLEDVLSTIPGVNTLSPTWFYFADTDGSVASIASQEYVDICHENGIEVWALFANEFMDSEGVRRFDSEQTESVLGYTSKRTYVINEIIGYVTEYGIDGINIDFESISQEGAADYIQFIRELSIACRANNIILSVDNYVPKYTYYYNRREQGVVADYVVIMGYDETNAGSDTPGPGASLPFVTEGITDTLKVVDKEKVINALPFYSRVWCTDTNGSVSSFACGMTEAEGYLTNHDVTPQFIEELGLNYGSYTSSVDGNLYEVWLQDDTAVEEIMKVVKEYDLAGSAAWKIGFEDSRKVWSIISSYLD